RSASPGERAARGSRLAALGCPELVNPGFVAATVDEPAPVVVHDPDHAGLATGAAPDAADLDLAVQVVQLQRPLGGLVAQHPVDEAAHRSIVALGYPFNGCTIGP